MVRLVHVAQPLVDVAQFAGAAIGVEADIALPLDQLAVDAPELCLLPWPAFHGRAGGGGDRDRAMHQVRPLHIAPCGRRFDHMGIGIDGRHWPSDGAGRPRAPPWPVK